MGVVSDPYLRQRPLVGIGELLVGALINVCPHR